jgi:hypothetical protein
MLLGSTTEHENGPIDCLTLQQSYARRSTPLFPYVRMLCVKSNRTARAKTLSPTRQPRIGAASKESLRRAPLNVLQTNPDDRGK